VLKLQVGIVPMYDVTFQGHCGRLHARILTRNCVLVLFRGLFDAFAALVTWIVELRKATISCRFQLSVHEESTLINIVDEHGRSLIDHFVKLCSEDDLVGLSCEGRDVLLERKLQKKCSTMERSPKHQRIVTHMK